VAWLNEELGTSLQPVYEPIRQGDIRHSYASIREAESVLGYRPLVEVRDGVRETVAWFREHEC
jgi:nucleoside-diphosphate-sugar epimerase